MFANLTKGEKSTIIRGATPGGREGAGVVEVDSRMYLYGGFALSSPIDSILDRKKDKRGSGREGMPFFDPE